MTSALDAGNGRSHRPIDLSWPILAGFAAILCALILLPIGWLVFYSFTDKSGALTLGNFVALVSDPSFVEPLVTTVIVATSSSLICCFAAAPMGWLVARTDMPLRRTVRILVTASFVTPPFLGAIAWELLAAPNSGLLKGVPHDHGRVLEQASVQHLLAARAHLRHLLLHLSPMSSCWLPMRSTAFPAISKTLRRSSAAGCGSRRAV